MAKMSMNYIIGIVFTLIVVSILLPIGLGYISLMGDTIVTVNGTDYALDTILDPTVLMLFTTLVPLGVAISIVMFFLGGRKT